MFNILVIKNNKIVRNIFRKTKEDAILVFINLCEIYIPSYSKYTYEYIKTIKEDGYHCFGNNNFIQIIKKE